MKNEEGFTLIEVVASLAIITIILLSFSSIFIQSNDHANLHSEKLVATNLADAYLERLRIEGIKLTCTPRPSDSKCVNEQQLFLNDQTYDVEIIIINDPVTENNMALQNIVVKVNTPDKRASAEVEGYIAYEKITQKRKRAYIN